MDIAIQSQLTIVKHQPLPSPWAFLEDAASEHADWGYHGDTIPGGPRWRQTSVGEHNPMKTIVIYTINHSEMGVIGTNLANYGAPSCSNGNIDDEWRLMMVSSGWWWLMMVNVYRRCHQSWICRRWHSTYAAISMDFTGDGMYPVAIYLRYGDHGDGKMEDFPGNARIWSKKNCDFTKTHREEDITSNIISVDSSWVCLKSVDFPERAGWSGLVEIYRKMSIVVPSNMGILADSSRQCWGWRQQSTG